MFEFPPARTEPKTTTNSPAGFSLAGVIFISGHGVSTILGYRVKSKWARGSRERGFSNDCPDAFHFVDPPYVGTDCGHYNGSFNDADFESLLKTLASVKGKFMLTMFPHPLIEKYATQNGWTIHRIERTITASKVSRRRQEEWIVTNYPDPRKAD